MELANERCRRGVHLCGFLLQHLVGQPGEAIDRHDASQEAEQDDSPEARQALALALHDALEPAPPARLRRGGHARIELSAVLLGWRRNHAGPQTARAVPQLVVVATSIAITGLSSRR